MTAIGGPLEGLTVLEARAKAIEMLTQVGTSLQSKNVNKRFLFQSVEKTQLRSSY